jgi:hypothetical protein
LYIPHFRGKFFVTPSFSGLDQRFLNHPLVQSTLSFNPHREISKS